MGATTNIGDLYNKISSLQSQNETLEDEYDEYENFKSAVEGLVEDHIKCWKQDSDAAKEPGVNQSCCFKSFLDKFTTALEDSSAKSLSSRASSLVGYAIQKQQIITRTIASNNSLISGYRSQIRNNDGSGRTTVKA